MSLYLVPSGDACRFKSRERLCRFLGLESPYNACLGCAPLRSETAPEGSVYAVSTSKTEIVALLARLAKSTVPSSTAADLLHELSNAVICKRMYCRRIRAPRLYATWCDKLWKHYLLVHGLDPKNCGSRPIKFTKKDWDSAVEEDDPASDSAYGSNNDPDYEPSDDSDDASEDDSDVYSDDALDNDMDDDSDGDPDDAPEDDSDKDGDTEDEDTDAETLGFGSLSIKSEAATEAKPSFAKYPQLSPADQLKSLFNTMTKNISYRNRCKGYIYGFRQRDLDGYLKIGYVQAVDDPLIDPVERRLAEWKGRCKHDTIEVFRARIDCCAVQRIESLIHLTLREHRRVRDPPCKPCRERSGGGKHDEWFKVDKDLAIKVVNFWLRFSRTQPYNRGQLSHFWYADIDFQMSGGTIPKDYPVLSWMKAMSPLVKLLAQRKRPDRWDV